MITKKLHRFLVTLLAAVLVWSSLPAQTAHAATITVNTTTDEFNTDGDCSLREAISAANTNAAVDACPAGSPGADTIILPAGTYQLTLVGSNNDNTAGDLDITEALTINGAGAGSTTIQQTVSGERVIQVVLNVTVNISGVTVRGGSENAAGGGGIYSSGPLTLTNSVVTNNTTTSSGGGIYVVNASVTLTNTTVSNNSTTGTGDGGGLRLDNSSATLSGAIFSNNTAAGDGGGIYVGDSSLSATNSTFSNNTGDSGGAIATFNDVTIISSTFSNNNANETNFGGGAIYAAGGTITVNQSLFEANRASGNGGGAISTNIDFSSPTLIVDRSTFRNNFTYDDFGNGGAISANGDLTVTNSTFNGNYTSGNDGVGAQNGGAVAAINSTLQMTNVTFSDNRANQHGGALYFRADNDSFLNNVTLASNQADANSDGGDGGGIYIDDIGGGAILTVRNSIIAPNSDLSGGAMDCSGGTVVTYSLIGNGAGCTLLAGSGNNLIGSNPNLGPLANNGGPTQTRALLAGSPAIDAADPGGSCATTDQRGVARFDGNYDSIVRCDMGAYEFNQPATTPTPTSPSTLPSTGFPMGRVSNLPAQPAEKAYAAYDELTLEIPSIGIKAPIVGVLKSEGGWDVSWLGNSVGWLEGSAFPTWQGNTVLTGHVWDADNTPGIFASIKTLKYGDRFTIRAFGQTYIYEVRENTRVWGGSGISKVFKHEEYDWVTLLTCEGYNPLTGKYFFRRMVRAVLIEVK